MTKNPESMAKMSALEDELERPREQIAGIIIDQDNSSNSGNFEFTAPEPPPQPSPPARTPDDSEEEKTILVKDEIPAHIATMGVDELRRKLITFNFHPGPIVPSTEDLYKKYLARLESSEGMTAEKKPPVPSPPPPPPAQTPDDVRESGSRRLFNYILIDPRKKVVGGSFRNYLESIFYIGKGTRSRPYSHLNETLNGKISEKTNIIRSIWAEGRGVIILYVFEASLSEEASTREACMIEALGLHCVANIRQRKLHGAARHWPPAKRLDYGNDLLRTSFQIFELGKPAEIRARNIQTVSPSKHSS